jgi:phosphatidylglycerophosphatase A
MRRAVASSGYLGLIPRRLWGTDAGAGTFGAALAAVMGVAMILVSAPWWASLGLAAAVAGLSLWSAAPFTASGEDPGWVCIDETAGTLLALVGLSGWPWLVALVVARAADIFKVLPGVRPAEGLPGAWGVTADDVIAGLYGLAAGWGLAAIL